MEKETEKEITYRQPKLLSVVAYPLDEKGVNKDKEYFIKFSKGYKMPEVNENYVVENMVNAARGLFMNSGLGYTYALGDKTTFQVKYKLKSKGTVNTVTFTTTGEETE